MNKQQVKGKANEIAGEIQENVGDALDNRSMEAKGHAREIKGKAEQKVGDTKEALKETDSELRERELRERELKNRDLNRP